jgi:uncharacterized membrane protein
MIRFASLATLLALAVPAMAAAAEDSKCSAADQERLAATSAYINAALEVVRPQISRVPADKMAELERSDPEMAKKLAKVIVFTPADEKRFRADAAKQICRSVTLAEHNDMARFYQTPEGKSILTRQVGLMPVMVDRFNFLFAAKAQTLAK